ncbi:MAG TPA: hypothetical protein PKD24_01445 [Pyrinomonadaceae bacterium]|nr:hypothetical protein [Pyrinomonadaceae bacterium]HMP64177.1 hypothetical protein [Pyrinomonadaceae bacterium]
MARVPQEIFLRVRFVSAKPIREGFANRVLSSQTGDQADMASRLQTAIDEGFGDFIVVAVNIDGQNPQTVAPTFQMLRRLNLAEIGDTAYLERRDGKRLSLIDYKTPVADDMGGKFVFPRTLDGEPFLTPESGWVRFVLNSTGNLKVNLRFDVKKMFYNGKLEY